MYKRGDAAYFELLEKNKNLVAEFFSMMEDTSNSVDSVIEQFISDDFVGRAFLPGISLKTKDDFRRFYQEFRKTMPKRKSHFHMFLAEDDLAMVYLTNQAYHEHGNFFGKIASGVRVEIPSVVMFRIKNGKFVENWHVIDLITPMTQLGILQGLSVFPELSEEYQKMSGIGPNNLWALAEPPQIFAHLNFSALPEKSSPDYLECMDRNRQMIATFYREVEDWNAQDGGESNDIHAVMGHYVAKSFASHSFLPGVPVEDWDQYGKIFMILKEQQPNRRSEFHILIAEGDIVMLYKTNHNLFERGNFFGVQGSGQRIDVPAVKIFRIKDKQFVEHWHVMDFTTAINLLKKPDNSLSMMPDISIFPDIMAEQQSSNPNFIPPFVATSPPPAGRRPPQGCDYVPLF